MMPNSGTTTELLNAAHFSIEIDKVAWGFFKSISGLSTETEVIESMAANKDGRRIIQKMPGLPKAGELTLTRTYTGDDLLYKWRQQVVDGKMTDARRNGSVVAYGVDGTAVAK